MKKLEELMQAESSWPLVQELIDSATNDYEVLTPETDAAGELVKLQQSVQSLMGAITYNTGGIIIDGGWLRIFGAGNERLKRTISEWNLGRSHDEGTDPGYLMVADDVLGGIFAVNGGELGDDIGAVYYLAPDTLEWEGLEVVYHEFLKFCFLGNLDDFYEYLRWEGWREDIRDLTGDQAIMMSPPLWEDDPDELKDRQKTVISVEEIYYDMAEAAELMLEEEEDDDDDDDEEEEDCECGCGDDCSCEDKEDKNH